MAVASDRKLPRVRALDLLLKQYLGRVVNVSQREDGRYETLSRN